MAVSANKAITAPLKLPQEVALIRYNKRLVCTIPSDIARFLDLTEDNARLQVTIIEGGLALYVKRKELSFG